MKELRQKEKTKKFLLAFFSAFCVLCALYGVKTICIDSPWRWSFLQKEFHLALVESVCVLFALMLAVCIPRQRRMRVLCVSLVVLLFSLLHAMLLVLLAMLLYAAMILMTGHLLCRALCKKHAGEPLAWILLGVSAMLLLVSLCSLVCLGTSSRLRIVYAVLFGLELVLYRKGILAFARTAFEKVPALGRRLSFEGLILSGVITALLIQVGRACVSLDYDSLWYGFRSGAMLAPFTGIYDKVIASGLVYSYSKGIETLSLAFHFDATYSFVQGVNLLLGGMSLYVAYRIALLFAEKRTALFASLCLAVTPGIMNMTVTAKSDIATLLCQLLLVYFVVKGLKEREGDALLLGLAAAVLSLCFKSSAIVFTSIVVLVAALVALVQRVRIRPYGLLCLILPTLANIALMARTLLLTGMPLTQMGAGIFALLGFSYKFPYAPASSGYMMSISALLTKEGLRARLPRLFRFFFSPLGEEMDHVIIAWGGILFAVAWISLVLLVFCRPKRTLARIKEDKAYGFMLISTAAVSAASLGSLLLLQKPDGNYYMLMYALTFVQLLAELEALPRGLAPALCKRSSSLVAVGALLALLTSWAWSLGFTPIKTEYRTAFYYDHARENEAYFDAVGVGEIADRLSEEGGRRRVMVFSGDIPRILALPAVAESWLDLSYWGNRELYGSATGLASYLEAADVEYLVLEHAFVKGDAELSARLRALAEEGVLSVEQSGDRYTLLRVDFAE